MGHFFYFHAAILSHVAQNEKPTVGFWYAFLQKKCMLHRFLGLRKKSRAQPARNQLLTNEPEMHHLYDKDDFPKSAVSDRFLRNPMRINDFNAANVLFEPLQICVKKNTCLSRKPKNACFFDAPPVSLEKDLTTAAKSLSFGLSERRLEM